MDVSSFRSLVQALTGTPVKDLTERDEAFLAEILLDDKREIDWSQLNELLLLVNKDRVEQPFFERFFGSKCQVADIPACVQRFQEKALLCYGNFIFGYRTLSRIRTDEELDEELGECARSPEVVVASFRARTVRLLDVDQIPREDTPLVGYLSAGAIIAEQGRAHFLKERLPAAGKLDKAEWEAYEQAAFAAAGSEEHRPLERIISNYRAANASATVADFAGYLDEVIPQLDANSERLSNVRATAIRNQDIYLTWDHMDVYFATSMRKRWEFEDLFNFVNAVMGQPDLADLNLRYFDPTQSYTAHRINKGLVESLMLKRAKCTVYSVQDTDTLGKDSELAATLAQGKPVIAYVPQIRVNDRVAQLVAEDPVTIQDRLRFVIYADEHFASFLDATDLAFVKDFDALEAFEQGIIWRSIPDNQAIAAFREEHDEDLHRICRVIAGSEARIYNKRAETLAKHHPLGIQVNLDTGVANGVLVVRNIEDCARLLRQVLTNGMEFDVEEDENAQMWYLRERISGCIFRIVTKDRKLTNCFWNFYRQPN